MNRSKDEIVHRKLERDSLNTWRVKNITPNKYFVRWDGRAWPVPGSEEDLGHGKGEAVLPYYLAKKFVKEMTEIIINEMNDARFAKKKEGARKKADMHPYHLMVEANAERTDNPALLKEYYGQMLMGMEEQYGLEGNEIPGEPAQDRDATKSLGDSVFDDIVKQKTNTFVEDKDDDTDELLSEIADED